MISCMVECTKDNLNTVRKKLATHQFVEKPNCEPQTCERDTGETMLVFGHFTTEADFEEAEKIAEIIQIWADTQFGPCDPTC